MYSHNYADQIRAQLTDSPGKLSPALCMEDVCMVRLISILFTLAPSHTWVLRLSSHFVRSDRITIWNQWRVVLAMSQYAARR